MIDEITSAVIAIHKKILINTMLAVLLLLAFSSAVKGQYIINVPYGSTPTIDGEIEYEEWSDAFVFSFNNTVVYVKHDDGKSLYVGLALSDYLPNGGDGVAFFIDVNHDGGTSSQMDDILFGVYRNGTSFEQRDEQVPSSPTGGWSVAVLDWKQVWMAEYNVTFPKIEVEPGGEKTLGIEFSSHDEDTGQEYYWPPEGDPPIPSNWGNLTSGDDWIPEFPLSMILPLFMILTILTIVFTKRMRARTET